MPEKATCIANSCTELCAGWNEAAGQPCAWLAGARRANRAPCLC